MASEEPTRQRMGVDLDTYHEFVEWVGDEPEEARLEFRARGESEDVAARTAASVGEWSLGGEEMGADREHEFSFGVPPEIEAEMGFSEPADRIEAVETALSAVAACINATVAYNALRDGIDVGDTETTVSLPVDTQVLFGHSDAFEDVVGDPEIEIEIDGTGLDDDEREKLAAYYRQSPVYGMLTHAHPNEPSVTVRGD
ncbi:hypothetical protein BV210_09440 [Halorientalis sp. IM1011]|uniref:OsmC family protein n=1 Tax=Halorientalis sp. IM1011 TaxID=1932360 RepID=UPI00097CD590|nr:OsmC family protein [Halorientalis sp. IM1011]AQL42924.1 hypothetical protein BV210_09440 [Halorientalis sp. IM1011]